MLTQETSVISVLVDFFAHADRRIMEIKQLISSDSVICNADVNSKKRALELMGELLSKKSDSSNPIQIFQQLTERENLGSTSLGHGVALPHARTSLCKKAKKSELSSTEPMWFSKKKRGLTARRARPYFPASMPNWFFFVAFASTTVFLKELRSSPNFSGLWNLKKE